MSEMSALFNRAKTLRGHGLTELRIFWRLREEFPNAERDMLLRVARLEGAPTGVTPGWALWGQPLRPTQIRFKNKVGVRQEEPVTIRTRKVIAVDYPLLTVEANDLREGDWIEDVGLVDAAYTWKAHTFVLFSDGKSEFLPRDSHVRVRLEDRGETG